MGAPPAILESLIARSRTPAVQYLAVDASSTRFEFHGGLADLDRGTALESTTTMMAYSMSKTLTAAAVLRLVEMKRIALDDSIAEWAGPIPYDRAISVRQLLTHTSGIPNPIPLRWVHPAAEHARFDESAALDRVLRAHARLAFRPGTRFSYSNLGYWLLGRVVERASREPFSEFVAAQLLAPLGLAASQLGYAISDPARHATGYLERTSILNLVRRFVIDPRLIGRYHGRWLSLQSHYVDGPAFGGLVGTAKGFARFLQDQLATRSRILGDDMRALFFERQQLASGTPMPMTLGWHVGGTHGRAFFYKEGGGGGFHSMMRLYRDRGVGTVIMVNATGFDVGATLDRLDPEFLA